MNVPADLKYTKEHEWIRTEGEIAFIGVTEFAQAELGDVVFIEIETVGETLAVGETFGTIEAVKTVSDLYMPVAGEVIEFNAMLEDKPEIVNSDPYGKGWMIKIKMSSPDDLNDLLSDEDYRSLIG